MAVEGRACVSRRSASAGRAAGRRPPTGPSSSLPSPPRARTWSWPSPSPPSALPTAAARRARCCGRPDGGRPRRAAAHTTPPGPDPCAHRHARRRARRRRARQLRAERARLSGALAGDQRAARGGMGTHRRARAPSSRAAPPASPPAAGAGAGPSRAAARRTPRGPACGPIDGACRSRGRRRHAGAAHRRSRPAPGRAPSARRTRRPAPTPCCPSRAGHGAWSARQPRPRLRAPDLSIERALVLTCSADGPAPLAPARPPPGSPSHRHATRWRKRARSEQRLASKRLRVRDQARRASPHRKPKRQMVAVSVVHGFRGRGCHLTLAVVAILVARRRFGGTERYVDEPQETMDHGRCMAGAGRGAGASTELERAQTTITAQRAEQSRSRRSEQFGLGLPRACHRE